MSGSSMLPLWLDNSVVIYPKNSKRVGFLDGTESTPSITFLNDSDTGFFSFGANLIGVSGNGNSEIYFNGGSGVAAFDMHQSYNNTFVTIKGYTADGATAVGVVVDTNNSFTTAGAKILSVRTGTNEKAYIDLNGGFATLGGMIQGRQGTDIASANNATITLTGNYFDVTGNTQINTLSTTGVQAGAVITLQFDNGTTVKHATAGTGAQFLLASASDFASGTSDTLTLVYDGTYYRELARTVI